MMIKVVMVLHRRPGLTVGNFRTYWREQHMPLVLKLEGLARVVLNYAQPSGSGSDALLQCDGVAEDWFESAEAMASALDSPAGQAVFADAPRFLDMSRFQMFAVEEEEFRLQTPHDSLA